MALFYITEYQAVGQAGLPTQAYGPNGPTQAALAPPVADQPPIAIGGSSTPSAAFNAATTLVRLHTDSICSFAFGTAAGSTPTASTANARMVAGQTEYFGVTPGMKVAVVANT